MCCLASSEGLLLFLLLCLLLSPKVPRKSLVFVGGQEMRRVLENVDEAWIISTMRPSLWIPHPHPRDLGNKRYYCSVKSTSFPETCLAHLEVCWAGISEGVCFSNVFRRNNSHTKTLFRCCMSSLKQMCPVPKTIMRRSSEATFIEGTYSVFTEPAAPETKNSMVPSSTLSIGL